jgi:hypothetical protein
MSETTDETWRGQLGPKTKEQQEEFLARGLAMRLACIRPSGHPHVTVVWHEWRDDAFWLVVRERAAWVEYLKNDPRCSFIIDVPETLEKVWGDGIAEIVEEPNVGGAWVPVCERMAIRYLGADGMSYMVPTLRQPRWLIRIDPVKMQSWQGVGWHPRYWVEGTGGPSWQEAHSGA